MKFLARWGNACGTPFKKKEFCDKNIQWEYQLKFLEDRDRQPWSFCSAVGMNESSEKIDKAIEADSDKTGYDLGSGKNTSSPTPSSSINKSMSPVTSPLSSPLPSPSRLNLASNNEKLNKETTITPTNNLPTQNPQLNPQPTLQLNPQLNPQLNLQQNPQPTLQLNPQQNPQQKPHILHSDAEHHHLLTSAYNHTGGSFVSENKKQMKEFMKMIKTKNGTKPKNKNTRRSKHNKSNKD
jgi:hypothetical protein